MVVLSPPGIIKPSHCSRSDAVRTSTVRPPASSIDLRCASKSPCSASTPTVFMRNSRRSLPASRLQQFAFGKLGDIEPAHSFAQLLAGFEQLHGVPIVRRRFDDGF